MYLYHACQRTKEDTSLLPHHYTIHEYASSESSASSRISDATLFSSDYPLQLTDLAGNLEQLEDPARPLTPDEADMGDAAPYRAALHRPFVEAVEAGDDFAAEEAVPYRAANHRPVVEAAEAGDDPDARDAVLYRQLSQICCKSSKGSS